MKKKLDLKRLRELMKKYPLASAAVAGGLALLLGWQVYQEVGAPRTGPTAVAPTAPARPSPTPSVAPTPGAPAAPGPTPAAPGPAAAPGGPQTPPAPPGPVTGLQGPAGRVDPFAPLVSTEGGGGRPVLPPVPVLGPGGVPLPGGPLSPSGGEGGLRLAGIIWDRGVIAIMADGRGSYIVGPGDEITPGLRVVRIDVARRVVQVQRSGGMQELTLQGQGGAGQ
jgi:hypothetical protein